MKIQKLSSACGLTKVTRKTTTKRKTITKEILVLFTWKQCLHMRIPSPKTSQDAWLELLVDDGWLVAIAGWRVVGARWHAGPCCARACAWRR